MSFVRSFGEPLERNPRHVGSELSSKLGLELGRVFTGRCRRDAVLADAKTVPNLGAHLRDRGWPGACHVGIVVSLRGVVCADVKLYSNFRLAERRLCAGQTAHGSHQPEVTMFKTVLVAADDSVTASRAVATAIELVAVLGGRLHVMTAYHPGLREGRQAARGVHGPDHRPGRPFAPETAGLGKQSRLAGGVPPGCWRRLRTRSSESPTRWVPT